MIQKGCSLQIIYYYLKLKCTIYSTLIDCLWILVLLGRYRIASHLFQFSILLL